MIREIKVPHFGWHNHKKVTLVASAANIRVWGKPLSLKVFADWWSDLGKEGQETYISEHPDSEKAKNAKEKQKTKKPDAELEDKTKKEDEDRVDEKMQRHERISQFEEKLGLDERITDNGYHSYEMHGSDPQELLEKLKGAGAQVTHTSDKDGGRQWNMVTDDHHVVEMWSGPDGELSINISEEPDQDLADKHRGNLDEQSKLEKKMSKEMKKHTKKLDKDAKESPIHQINDEHKEQVVSILEKLKKMSDEAKDKGLKAPNFDLCQVSVPGTNLFCEANKGIPRAKMPQLKGKPVDGTDASELPVDDKGEINAEDAFKDALRKHGVSLKSEEIDASRLKATQSQLVGPKVAGMLGALRKNPDHEAIRAPIFVSKDGYILDGHHRWAAVVGLSLVKDEPIPMKTVVVDMTAEELVQFTNDFANKFGIEQKGA
jgi:hypothetical protein